MCFSGTAAPPCGLRVDERASPATDHDQAPAGRRSGTGVRAACCASSGGPGITSVGGALPVSGPRLAGRGRGGMPKDFGEAARPNTGTCDPTSAPGAAWAQGAEPCRAEAAWEAEEAELSSGSAGCRCCVVGCACGDGEWRLAWTKSNRVCRGVEEYRPGESDSNSGGRSGEEGPGGKDSSSEGWRCRGVDVWCPTGCSSCGLVSRGVKERCPSSWRSSS